MFDINATAKLSAAAYYKSLGQECAGLDLKAKKDITKEAVVQTGLFVQKCFKEICENKMGVKKRSLDEIKLL